MTSPDDDIPVLGPASALEDDADGLITPDPIQIDRRKLLLGLGFGATNLAVLRAAGGRTGPGADSTDVSTTGGQPTVTVLSEAGPQAVATPATIAGAQRAADSHIYDQVIRGGRVIDPESGFDAIADVGIDGGTVTNISATPLQTAGEAIDATGMVVSPGFIDILSYEPNGYGEWFKIADGVTTNLGLHGIDASASDFFAKMERLDPPVHYGGASDNAWVRPNVAELDPYDVTDSSQIERIVDAAETDVRNGACAIHMQPEYTPGATADEVIAHARLAASVDVPLCMHIRYSEDIAPGTQAEAIDEVVRAARETGAHVHVEHINSTGGTNRMLEALATLEAARDEGLRITACVYPYTFWATYLKSSRYDGWQEKFGITYGDLQVAGTAGRLTEATYQAAYDANLLTAAYAMPQEDIDAALRTPWVMLGSDAILQPPHNNHPRSTGCFSRVLGPYVRDRNILSLPDALAKMTILPAQLLASTPAMTKKGRVQIGSDADLCVFDPATITDRSTIENPAIASLGVSWVLVDGTIVKRPTGAATLDGRTLPDGVDTSARPGTAIVSA